MTTPTIEERLALLEQKVARLSGEAAPEETAAPQIRPAPWWEQWVGAFKDNPDFDAAMERGAEYRRSQPTAYEENEIAEGENHVSS